ncbi:EamA family transporter [Desulfosarcina sp. OttesenSCG-928-A07]|nr:EamA family transporter [Desulfosarcina sp. OttesenSCG-928-G17]MDL2328799.1 EamA family transporter [Desulfosarcina sp. OttesenSCG-928-A07]
MSAQARRKGLLVDMLARNLLFQPSHAAAGYFYAVLAAILWSLIGPFSKVCLASDIGPVEAAFWRVFLGGMCFLVQAAMHGSLFISWRHAVLFFLFGGWGVGVLSGALQISIQLSGAAMAMVLMYTAPAWVAVASRVLFHEPISRQKFLAICIALGGTTLICFSGGSLMEEHSSVGIFCGLLSGITYASHFPFYTWWKHSYPAETIYAYMLLGGAAFLLPFSDFTPDKPVESWGYLISFGFLTNYIAYIALTKSLQRINPVKTAVIGNIEPILATILVWMFFGENFTHYGWFGCGLVIFAVFLLTLEKKPAPQRDIEQVRVKRE